MGALPDFGYAQARIQARFGDLPDVVTWQRLSATRTLRAYLETARATSVAAWVENLSDASDVHDIEASVRGSLYQLVGQVARWVPPAWAQSVSWVRWLAYLPAIRSLLAGGPVPPWMSRGHRLRPYLQDSVAARADALTRAGGGPLVAAWRRDAPLAQAWLDAWRARWPGTGAPGQDALDEVQARLLELRRRLAESGGSELLPEARACLVRDFRRHQLTPAAVFAFLGVQAMDLARLRGDLVLRAIGV